MLKPIVVYVMVGKMKVTFCYVIFATLLLIHSVLAWDILSLKVIGFAMIVQFPGQPMIIMK